MRVFRPTAVLTEAVALRRTFTQLVLFWLSFLGLGPALLVLLEARYDITRWPSPTLRVAGATLLVAASALGFWSARSMARLGRGTPMPSACAPRLVTTGPYRRVRNPMAVAGIAQGLAVGLVLGSTSVVLYALAGAVVWHLGVRPYEERDLARRFGAEYSEYRARTGLWWPRRPVGT